MSAWPIAVRVALNSQLMRNGLFDWELMKQACMDVCNRVCLVIANLAGHSSTFYTGGGLGAGVRQSMGVVIMGWLGLRRTEWLKVEGRRLEGLGTTVQPRRL